MSPPQISPPKNETDFDGDRVIVCSYLLLTSLVMVSWLGGHDLQHGNVSDRALPILSPALASPLLALLGFGLLLFQHRRSSRSRTEAMTASRTETGEARTKLEAILDSVAEAVVVVDAKGVVTSWNPSAGEVFGYTSEEMIGRNISVLVPDPHRERHDSYMRRALDDEASAVVGRRAEVEAVCKGGKSIPVELHVAEVKGTEGRCFVACVRDLTDTHRAAEEKREAEERFQTIAASLADAIVVTDVSGRIEWANAAACSVTGYPLHELVGQKTNIFNSGHHSRSYFKKMWRTIGSGQTWRGEIVNRHRDGQLQTQDMTITPILGPGGKAQRYVAVKRDISARVQRERETRRLQDALVASSRTAGMAEVATGVLHDVGNALSSIGIAAELASDRLRDTSVTRLITAADMLLEREGDLAGFLAEPKGRLLVDYLPKAARQIEVELNHSKDELSVLLGHLGHVKRVLASQQAHAKNVAVVTRFEIDEVLDDALELAGIGAAKGVNLRRDVESSSVLEQDRTKLLQVLTNLLSNAWQATESGPEPAGEILITVTPAPNGNVRFQVRDRGEGIAASDLERIFVHGFTTKSEGHGFGLHSAALAAKELGGSLSAESQGMGAGATFTLTIPAAAVVTHDVPPPLQEPLSQALASEFAGERVEFCPFSVVTDIVDALLARAVASEVSLEVKAGPDVPERVRGDEPRLTAILLRLVTQALSSSVEGSTIVGLNVLETCETGLRLEFSVTTSSGDLGRTFESNVEDGAQDFVGLSQGQATPYCRDVDLLKGTLTIDQTPEAGSCAKIAIPLAHPSKTDKAFTLEPAEAGDLISDELQRTLQRPNAPRRVLLVDDDTVTRLVGKRLLERIGLLCDLATDGREALDAWTSERYDLILMDCTMPRLNGLEATEAIRRRELGAERVPIIALTASAGETQRRRCLEAGMDDHFAKPLDSRGLEALLTKWLTPQPSHSGENAPTPV